MLGWATGLNLVGAGPYDLVGTDTIDAALLAAARAIRLTGKPVGLLMWHGRHAWVMSGFRATADPLNPDAKVTAVFVEDPLYPFGSSSWGPSPAPGAALTPAELGRQFVPRRSSNRWSATPWGKELAGKYVLVLPTKTDPHAVPGSGDLTRAASAARALDGGAATVAGHAARRRPASGACSARGWR